jgi:hypothetical protein
MSENISLTINCEEDTEETSEYNISSSGSSSDDLFLEMESYNTINSAAYAEVINYELNYTAKQLNQICDYYGIKLAKRNSKKAEIISFLVTFETTQSNYEIVSRRKQLWYYVTELKNDKFFKKFVIW